MRSLVSGCRMGGWDDADGRWQTSMRVGHSSLSQRYVVAISDQDSELMPAISQTYPQFAERLSQMASQI